jgi:hypothetical protein
LGIIPFIFNGIFEWESSYLKPFVSVKVGGLDERAAAVWREKVGGGRRDQGVSSPRPLLL